VLDQSRLAELAPTDATPEALERLHDALTRFYDKCARDTTYFRDIAHGVGWVWATFRRLRELQEIANASGPRLDPLDESDPAQSARLAAAGPGLPGAANRNSPSDVILEYFARPGAPRQGRLGLTAESIRVVEWVASAGLVPQGGRIPTALWAQIAEELGRSNAAVRDLYKTAKLGFAVLYYVIGALGPAEALRDPDALAAAVEDFRHRFAGQREWSILKFAAHSAAPQGDRAQVDPDRYNEAIRRNAPQARRLGWTPGMAPPAVLLDAVEHQTAALFGRTHPWCALPSHHAANPPKPGS
jgi:hypothetical protein